MSRAVVVGSGISGILSAFLLKEKFNEVIVIEKENRIGGLFQSKTDSEGFSFDQGTHFLHATGNPTIDQFMLEDLDHDWLQLRDFDHVAAANFFAGQLNTQSPCMDTRKLAPEIYEQGIKDFELAEIEDRDFSNCEEKLVTVYGKTFYENVFQPALEKFFKSSVSELDQNAYRLFTPSRLIAYSAEKTKELKLNPSFNSRLAFHSYSDIKSSLPAYYPEQGGMGRWVEAVHQKMKRFGIEVKLATEVAGLEFEKGNIRSLTINNDETLSCEHLVWTVPSIFFGKLVGRFPKTKPPQIQSSVIFHMKFDRKFLCEEAFVTNYDADFNTFRVSLYPNYSSSPSKDVFHCSVEIISEPDQVESFSSKEIVKELKAMKIVGSHAQLIWSEKQIAKAGFPVPTAELVRAQQDYQESLAQDFLNVSFVGKAQNKVWFVNEVLADTYEQIQSLSNPASLGLQHSHLHAD